MKKYLVSNPSFILRSLRGLEIKPYAVDQEVSDKQFVELKRIYPNILKYRVEEVDAVTDNDVTISLVDELELSAPVKKALAAGKVVKIEDLTAMTAAQVLELKGIADAGLAEIVDALKSVELALKEAE
ncbi:hypothetical protein K6U51_12340 [Vibrio fluvialis]|uniref:DNA-directed RNA polymerase subunit alpha C-terminal domain-containing protein n=1 Tax=Vibrio fluvialis TaxID=676 RepID=UPI001EEAAD1B|nr:DNA-directed RNA polymerase subunit alpha C-terminal domain-containing protein [Vibrio fluvialis]MCG6387500.1 hypothetical protein [Vibrio fluvialis]MCG6418822.1 hypothetical protein [Vibrio fluvialis]